MGNLYYEQLQRECDPDRTHLHLTKDEIDTILDALDYCDDEMCGIDNSYKRTAAKIREVYYGQ
ncbi:MAG: hypothetical protein J6V38_02855 [Kiritimatiellae bacterium]|nr:hypothetical protein [Kiritimatiellia bacterium]